MCHINVKLLTKSGLLCGALVTTVVSQALEISVGDYEPLPDKLNLSILYMNTTSGSDLYSKGHKIADDFKLYTHVALLRMLRSIQVADGVTMEPQVVIPYGSLKTTSAANVLGDSDGLGDIIFGLPFKWSLSNTGHDVFALAPFLYMPTGEYDRQQTANLGENRWRFLLQSTYIHHFSGHWALDSAADVSWYTTNNDYAGHSELKQSMRYELQSYLRYSFNDQSMLGIGVGHIDGAEQIVDGVNQDNPLSTTYVRTTLSYFVALAWQLQGLAGKDLSVSEGIKQDAQFQLRITHVF